jgi:chemotaxis protein methyltransferase CheR
MLEAVDHLSSRDFRRLAEFIHAYSGIKVPETKKSMVEGRLRRRRRLLGLDTLEAYCRYLFDQDGLESETVGLIDSVTTNKTDFFREADHFDYLAETAIPDLFAEREISRSEPLRIWSAACSIGAEPYTLAMVAAEVARERGDFRYSILATDICTEALETARTAIYPAQMIEPVPAELRRRYVLRAKTTPLDRVRIAPEVRSMVAFGRINLMEAPYRIDRDMHVIFCRNILIYFDKPTQKKVLEQLCAHLRPGGYLFVGHSETLAGLGLPLKPVATTVFRKWSDA